MSTRRELVLKAFRNEVPERVPVGFWFHFLEGDEFNATLERPELLDKNLAGHKKFFEEFDPDFVKIMTDGLFFLPYDFSNIEKAADLRNFKGLPKEHPAFAKNVELVKGVRKLAGEDRLLFFNEFSPFNYLNLSLGGFGGGVFGQSPVKQYIEEDPEAVAYALNVIAEDLIYLLSQVVQPGLADGIYLSVNNPNRGIPAEKYEAVIAPSERKILRAANEYSQDNILHICGYAGNQNILSVYQSYEASIINWAVHAEDVSLKDGKKLFGDKPVIGGFGNTKDGLLFSGSKEEIEQYVEKIVNEVGKRGVVIGADCTVPSDIDIERLKWVRDKAATL